MKLMFCLNRAMHFSLFFFFFFFFFFFSSFSFSFSSFFFFLWPPYGIGQAIICLLCGFYLSSSYGSPVVSASSSFFLA